MTKQTKTRTLYSCLVLIVITVYGMMLITGCTGDRTTAVPNKTSTEVVPQPGDMVSVTSGLAVPLSMEELVGLADAIVIGTVSQILPSRQIETDSVNLKVYTNVLVNIERYLYG